MMAILSVGAIIYDSEGKLLLQKRDLKRSIYFPGLWGVFGGACEKNENPSETIVREIYEELQISIASPKLFITMGINSLDLGSEQLKRHFYEMDINLFYNNKSYLKDLCNKIFDEHNTPIQSYTISEDYKADRFLFASSYPERPLKQTVEEFNNLPFRPDVLEKALFKNAQWILGDRVG